MIDFIFMSLCFILTVGGTVYLILDILNLDSERNQAKGKTQLPHHLKWSFGLYLGAFLLTILVNLF